MGKNAFFIFILLLICTVLSAQTQQGYVKTIGRPGKPGKGVAGVTLRFTGCTNMVVTDAGGVFSVSIPGKKDGDAIKLLSMRKNGYELKDKGMIGQSLVVSSEVPIIISVVSTAQLKADRKRIEDNAFRVADKNYKRRLSTLEKEVKDSKISRERYQTELQQLQHDYEQYMSLIGDMADRYARTDYDGLDSIDIEINKCIEDGELEKADSLILSVFDPTTVLDRNRAAKKELEDRMNIVRQSLDKLHSDRDAIMKDIDYAKRIAGLGLRLARQYDAQGNNEKAKACYQEVYGLMVTIYGADSEEAKEAGRHL